MSETIIGMPSLISDYILFRILELCPLICQKILLCFSWSGHIHVLFFGVFFYIIFLFIFLFTFYIYRKLHYLRKSYRNKSMMRILVQIRHPLGKNMTCQEMARDNLEVTEDVDFYPLMSLSGRKRYSCSIYYFYFFFILLNL